MCDICKKNTMLDWNITDAAGNVINICPNCIANKVYNNELIPLLKKELPGNTFISEISGKPEAVKITDSLNEYTVTYEEADRLLGCDLKPEEYLKLMKTHSDEEYLLHDDYYNEDGKALQPVRER